MLPYGVAFVRVLKSIARLVFVFVSTEIHGRTEHFKNKNKQFPPRASNVIIRSSVKFHARSKIYYLFLE